jgi:hypothetical protein
LHNRPQVGASCARLRSTLDGTKITLRNGARIIEKTWPADD